MNDELLLTNLEELARKLAIKVIHDKNLTGPGGICRYQAKHYVLIKSKSAVKEQIRLYTRAIARVIPEDYFVMPVIRELLENEKLRLKENSNDEL